jgi:hypothetical protein
MERKPSGQVIDGSKVLLGDFRSWEVRHVKRGSNTAAHGLVKFATNGSIDQVWMEEMPSICIPRALCSFYVEFCALVIFLK